MATTLLLLGLRRALLEPPRQVPGATRLIRVTGELLERARAGGIPVVHVRDGAGALYHAALDGERVLDVTGPDAFAGPELAALIPARSAVVTAGLLSDGCVRATVLSGLRQGYEMRLVRGAHAAQHGGGRAADEIAARIELELEAAGAKLANPHGRLFWAAPSL